MDEFKSPDDLYVFITSTLEWMEESGMDRAASRLAVVQSTAYTTGSEWLGDLGVAIRGIEAQFEIPGKLQMRLDRMMAAVHRAWPEM